MAKTRNIDAKLNRLRALCQDAPSPQHVEELRKSLGDASNIVVAEAAEIVAERSLADLVPDLLAAFDRFLIEPVESDKLCRGKIAVIEALNKMEYDKEEIFLRGIKHVQREPRWGEPEDTAAPLRGHCAFGLVRMNYREAIIHLAELLADSQKVARMMAAQALGETRSQAAIPLLRFKARVGDPETEVTNECLTALIVAAPKESLGFVASFLEPGDDAVRQGAACALGESRKPEALEILKEFWPRAEGNSLKETVLLAIALTRLAAGIEFLVDLLASEDKKTAAAALSALAIHRHNVALKERIANLVTAMGDTAMLERFRKKFET